ncbi:MAG: hypothetical protein DMG32_17345 [Acidobacteria bacterium]|nr:MAG: hypothetical protein DMG32_17345 [Acidobacteriota bacterium]
MSPSAPRRTRSASRPTPLEIRFRPSVKRIRNYEAPEEGREGKLRLDFNENTIGCSPAVMRALRKITPEQLAMYPEYENSLRRLAAYFGVRPSEMLLTNGVDDALRLFMEVFIEPGDAVLIPEPTFSMYRFFSQVAGARIISVRYDEEMRFPGRWFGGAAHWRALRARRRHFGDAAGVYAVSCKFSRAHRRGSSRER